MKNYKIVAKAKESWSDCEGCIFRYDDTGTGYFSCEDGCNEPMELNCNKNIWILEELDEDN